VASVEVLVDTLKENLKWKRLILCFAAAKDKDISGMLRILMPLTDEAVFTTTASPRSATTEYLAQTASSLKSLPITKEADPVKAFELAKVKASSQDLILITGSFYLAGKIKEALESG
jgi:dihydrofolate synthase/folylpolyglutamate synthase